MQPIKPPLKPAPREKLVFDHTMESVIRLLGKQPSPEQAAALLKLGVDVAKPLLPAYPLPTYLAVKDYVGSQRWPHLPPEQAHFEQGCAFIKGYAETWMGKALFTVARVLGPERMLERMSQNFRGGNNFTETRLVKLGPARFELWFNIVTRVNHVRGILTTGLELTGAKQPEVKVLSFNEPEATFLITWSA
jgi:uncharacterized protein (TIGR02265 family)